MAIKVEVIGLKELLEDIEEKFDEKTLRQVQKKAIKNAGDIMLKELQQQAPRADVGSKSSYKYLLNSVFLDKGLAKAKIGINSANFELTRGLFFHQLGFKSHPADDFFGRSFSAKENEVYNSIKDDLEEALGD